LLGGDNGAPGFFGEQFGGGMHGRLPWMDQLVEPYGACFVATERTTERVDSVLRRVGVQAALVDR
jgi:hypothetical protein